LKILLTNDDGIHAPGLNALYEELNRDFDVSIVAPESEMSAAGHSITLSNPLKVREIKKNGAFYGLALNGTPADSVKIAVQELLDKKPDIILSGINLGANVGINVLYSGTVSAATEGAFLGIPSVALSLDTRKDADFSFAAGFSRKVIGYIKENKINNNTALNINIPAVPENKIKGVSLARQSLDIHREKYERRVDPRGNVYYWLTGEFSPDESAKDTDTTLLKQNMITITPITYDLTSLKDLEKMKNIALPEV
jgi:5'-nucleotidase